MKALSKRNRLILEGIAHVLSTRFGPTAIVPDDEVWSMDEQTFVRETAQHARVSEDEVRRVVELLVKHSTMRRSDGMLTFNQPLLH